jgi:magnesium transporter
MSKSRRRLAKKAGLPPGSIVYTGDNRTGKIGLFLMEFDEDATHEHHVNSVDEIRPYLESGCRFWLQVTGLDQVERIVEIGKLFHLHPLVLEDIVNTAQRPKVEEIGDGLFFDFNLLVDEAGAIRSEQISLVLGPHYVVTFQERPYEFFDQNRARLRQERERLPHAISHDYILYTLQDSIIDSCFVALEALEDRMEALEDQLVDNPAPTVQKDIYHLRRDLTLFRKAVWPLRDIFNRVLYAGMPGIDQPNAIYFRDLHDHVIQILETVDSLRDVVSGMLDIYLSAVSYRMNQIMKVLTIISTIFIPLTFIAGVYGMNFDFMPELRWRWGYPVIWGVMLLIVLVMIRNFRRKGWF